MCKGVLFPPSLQVSAAVCSAGGKRKTSSSAARLLLPAAIWSAEERDIWSALPNWRRNILSFDHRVSSSFFPPPAAIAAAIAAAAASASAAASSLPRIKNLNPQPQSCLFHKAISSFILGASQRSPPSHPTTSSPQSFVIQSLQLPFNIFNYLTPDTPSPILARRLHLGRVVIMIIVDR